MTEFDSPHPDKFERSENLARVQDSACALSVENRKPEHVQVFEDGEAGSRVQWSLSGLRILGAIRLAKRDRKR